MDWALNVGFYAIYHCFLSILAWGGYESRNQSCTVTAVLKLIEGGRIKLDKDLVMQFDTLDVDEVLPTVRNWRESSTYGILTEINLDELQKVKELLRIVQQETIKIITS